MKPVTIFSPKMSNAILRRYIESTVNDRFFTIEFIKADGSKRVMNGRLGVKKHLKGGQNCNDIDRFLTMYDGEKEGYFTLHCEHAAGYPFRMLAWMVFLNEAKSGTEFPFQNRILKPKTGRLAIWPAAWTHPHRGVTPNQGLKYIATGWGYFLPKKRNEDIHISFDGRHADEEKIKEIVV